MEESILSKFTLEGQLARAAYLLLRKGIPVRINRHAALANCPSHVNFDNMLSSLSEYPLGRF